MKTIAMCALAASCLALGFTPSFAQDRPDQGHMDQQAQDRGHTDRSAMGDQRSHHHRHQVCHVRHHHKTCSWM